MTPGRGDWASGLEIGSLGSLGALGSGRDAASDTPSVGLANRSKAVE